MRQRIGFLYQNGKHLSKLLNLGSVRPLSYNSCRNHTYRSSEVQTIRFKKSYETYSWAILAECGIVSVGFIGSFTQCAGKDDKSFEFDYQKIVDKAKEYGRKVAEMESVADLLGSAQGKINAFVESGAGGQISWGFMMGLCSGFFMRKVSKFGAMVLGASFVAMQCASYTGYINVNYKKLERDMTDFMDLNQDGKVDNEDLEMLYVKLMKVLEFSLPAGGAFASGFIFGFRRG